MQTRPEVPEDVRAEIDLEERRKGVMKEAPPTAAAATPPVPEDVLSEQDHEERLAREDLHLRIAEGQPPADGDDDRRT
jgi:hypothetical protein